MKRHCIFIILCLLTLCLKGQVFQEDVGTASLSEFITSHLERIAEDSDEEIDFTELVENYIYYSENPISINGDENSILVNLHLINELQLKSLNDYRRQYGDILFIEELEMVEGFDAYHISLLTPVVSIGTQISHKTNTIKNLRYGKHQVVARYEQVLEKSLGYMPIEEEELLKRPNSRYLGSPQRYYMRYTYNYRNKIRAGFCLEKDPGELFWFDKVGDSVAMLLGEKRYRGFDYRNFHLYLSNYGVIKSAAVGRYHLSYGQGLTMWTGMSFGKASDGSAVMKRGNGITPISTSAEGQGLWGVATTLAMRGVEMSLFYSYQHVDANVTVTDTLEEPEYITSLQNTGYHRTIGEILDRHAIKRQLLGGHISYNIKNLEIGYTIHHTNLSAALVPTPSIYNQYYFKGTELTNQGVDLKIITPHFAFFGEGSMSDNKALATMIGMSVTPAGYINFNVIYRNYQRHYQNIFSNAFGEASNNRNEEGVYLGLQAGIAPYWQLTGYADFFRFGWITSQAYMPSWGKDYFIQVDHQVNKSTTFYLRLRSKDKIRNTSNGEIYIPYPTFYRRLSARFNISYALNKSWTLKNKVEYIRYQHREKGNSHGYFICQDISFKPHSKPFSLTFRYALFDTDDYDSRVYAYENDVLYAFSVPSFSDKGMRIYLVGKTKVIKGLTLYGKVARTIYSHKDEIGSGLTLIEGNHKTEVKLEAIWKL